MKRIPASQDAEAWLHLVPKGDLLQLKQIQVHLTVSNHPSAILSKSIIFEKIEVEIYCIFIFKQNFEVQTIPRQYNNTRLSDPLLLNCCSWQCKIVHKDLLHTRKEKNTCIRSSVFKRLLASCSLRASPRWLIIASISSRNIVEGAWCLASSNNTLINFSESPAMCSISRYSFHYDRGTKLFERSRYILYVTKHTQKSR